MRMMGRFYAVGAVLVCFGPYLTAGIRTDQVFFYSCTVGATLFAPWTWARIRLSGPGVAIVAAWLVLVAVAVAGLLAPPVQSQFMPGQALAGLDNVMLPVAVAVATWLLVPPGDHEDALRVACKTVAWLAALNGAVALVSTRIATGGLLRPFWGGTTDSGLTVSELASELGRFSGIFNQPAEAGLMYGLGAVGAVYAYRDRQRGLVILLWPIFLGGALCVSKVFLLVGAPVAVWQVLRASRSRLVLVLSAATGAVVLATGGLLAGWAGTSYLRRLIDPTGGGRGYVDLYTAGRFGGRGTLSIVVGEVTDRAPVFGFGARGLRVPYDNGWVEALVVAGWVGAVCYTMALAALYLVARTRSGASRRFGYGLALIVAGASVGVPALTANRAGAVVWLFAALLAARPQLHRQGDHFVAHVVDEDAVSMI